MTNVTPKPLIKDTTEDTSSRASPTFPITPAVSEKTPAIGSPSPPPSTPAPGVSQSLPNTPLPQTPTPTRSYISLHNTPLSAIKDFFSLSDFDSPPPTHTSHFGAQTAPGFLNTGFYLIPLLLSIWLLGRYFPQFLLGLLGYYELLLAFATLMFWGIKYQRRLRLVGSMLYYYRETLIPAAAFVLTLACITHGIFFILSLESIGANPLPSPLRPSVPSPSLVRVTPFTSTTPLQNQTLPLAPIPSFNSTANTTFPTTTGVACPLRGIFQHALAVYSNTTEDKENWELAKKGLLSAGIMGLPSAAACLLWVRMLQGASAAIGGSSTSLSSPSRSPRS